MVGLLATAFLVLLVIGVPIAFSMGIGSFLALAFYMPNATMTIAAKMFGGLDSFSLMAIPYFLLAGNLMEAAGISKQLVEFAELLVGKIKGGLAMAAVVSGVILAGVSGSNAADTSAIGSIMIPALKKKGYEDSWSCALISTTGILGPIIPPSILAILYSTATGLSVGALFIAGIIPGIILAVGLLYFCYSYAKRNNLQNSTADKRSRKEVLQILLVALPALVMPGIIIGGILTGFFTATESASVACIYAILYGVLSKRLTAKNLWHALREAVKTACKLMLIISVASLFGWIFSVTGFPAKVVATLTGITSSKYIILLLIVVLLLLIGCFMETIAALTILVPVLNPVAAAYGISNIQFAMFFIVTLLIGAITPPVGVNLYITSGIAGIRFADTLKYLPKFIILSTVVAVLVALVPGITTWLPGLLGFTV